MNKTIVGQAISRDNQWLYTWFVDGTVIRQRKRYSTVWLDEVENGVEYLEQPQTVDRSVQHNDQDFFALVSPVAKK